MQMKRFSFYTRNPSAKGLGFLTSKELYDAQIILIKLLQSEAFSEELKLLKKNQFLSKQNPISHLNPFLDENGIIRVGGRLKNADLPYQANHPALIPSNHHFTKFFIMHEHVRHFHAGSQPTLAAVRQKFWPCSGRDVVRHILRKCVTCIRCRSKLYPILW